LVQIDQIYKYFGYFRKLNCELYVSVGLSSFGHFVELNQPVSTVDSGTRDALGAGQKSAVALSEFLGIDKDAQVPKFKIFQISLAFFERVKPSICSSFTLGDEHGVFRR
jgi:hypothetical protein